MLAFNLQSPLAVLLALACPPTFLSTVAGQPPIPETREVNTKNTPGQRNVTDRDRLQGEWQILSITIEDKVIKREDARNEWKQAFEKDLFVAGDQFGQVGYSNARLKLDEALDPKQITIQADDGKLTFRGIYALEGDTLKVCMNGDGTDVRRPEEFVTRKGTPLLLVVLKKRPPAK